MAKARCPDCQLHQELCVCAECPKRDTSSRLILVMHAQEIVRPSNSGKLALLCLNNGEMRIRGERDKPLDTSGFEQEQYTSLLLYPSQDSQELNENFLASLTKPVQLIVPDGNWGQAGRTARRIAKEFNFQKVHIAANDLDTHYRLRKEVHEGGMATFEAIARAMGVLEGRTLRETMEKFFSLWVERMLRMRGIHS